jgi:hypothetical protein
MTKALPFTEASIARIIKGVERAWRFVAGVRPDGTPIVSGKPVASMIRLLASRPLWVAGGFLVIMGSAAMSIGIFASEGYVDRDNALVWGLGFVICSAPLLLIAAKVAS